MKVVKKHLTDVQRIRQMLDMEVGWDEEGLEEAVLKLIRQVRKEERQKANGRQSR